MGLEIAVRKYSSSVVVHVGNSLVATIDVGEVQPTTVRPSHRPVPLTPIPAPSVIPAGVSTLGALTRSKTRRAADYSSVHTRGMVPVHIFRIYLATILLVVMGINDASRKGVHSNQKRYAERQTRGLRFGTTCGSTLCLHPAHCL